MIKITQKVLLLLLPLTLPSALAHGQDTPAVVTAPSFSGFSLPNVAGTLNYSVSGSESTRTSYQGSGDRSWSSNLSGNLGYLSGSAHPFSAVVSGGLLYYTGGGDGPTFYQNISASQVFSVKRWQFVATDGFSYLPETASSGLSGIPGQGDVGIPPLSTGPSASQGILTNTGARINNSASIGGGRPITASTSLSVSAAYSTLTYLGNSSGGLDNASLSASAGLSRRLDARDNIGGSYGFSRYTYPASTVALLGGLTDAFVTQSFNLSFSRSVSRLLSFHASAGPQISTSGGSTVATNSPSTSISLSTDVGISYAAHYVSYNLGYSRGVSAGSGVVQGSIADSISLSANRRIGEYLSASASGGYTRNQSLAILSKDPFSIQTIVGNAQLSRSVGRYLTAFLSYSAQKQTTPTAGSINAFNGFSQDISVGLSYSPSSIHFGHQ